MQLKRRTRGKHLKWSVQPTMNGVTTQGVTTRHEHVTGLL